MSAAPINNIEEHTSNNTLHEDDATSLNSTSDLIVTPIELVAPTQTSVNNNNEDAT